MAILTDSVVSSIEDSLSWVTFMCPVDGVDFFLFWNWKLQNRPKDLGLNCYYLLIWPFKKDYCIHNRNSSRFIYKNAQFQYKKKNQELPLSWNSNQLCTWAHKCHLKGGWLAPFDFCHLLLCLIRAWTGVHPTKWIANFTKYPLCCGGILNFTEFYYGMYVFF